VFSENVASQALSIVNAPLSYDALLFVEKTTAARKNTETNTLPEQQFPAEPGPQKPAAEQQIERVSDESLPCLSRLSERFPAVDHSCRTSIA